LRCPNSLGSVWFLENMEKEKLKEKKCARKKCKEKEFSSLVWIEENIQEFK